MSEWEVIPENNSEWQIDNAMNSQRKSQAPRRNIPGWLLGLGQFGEDFIKGGAEDTRSGEPEFPEHWKPEKIRRENRPENSEPSLNLEEYLDPEEETQFNVGRYGPALIAALFGGGKGLKNLIKPYTNKSLGHAVVAGGKEAKREAKRDYNAFFDTIEGASPQPISISVPTAQLSRILSATTDKKYYKGLQKAIDNPTPRNVHFAQSDLGKFIRRLSGKKELSTPEHDALKDAIEAQGALKNDLYSSLMNTGGLDAPFQYAELGEKFAKKVVPYLEDTAIRKASLKPGQKGYINPKRLPNKLAKESSDPFQAHIRGNPETGDMINPHLHGKYPELELNRRLTNPYLLGTLATATGAGGVAALVRSLMWNK